MTIALSLVEHVSRTAQATNGHPITYYLLIALVGLIVGTLTGLTGVGGGSLVTPLLVLMLGIAPTIAVGTDLLYSVPTKLLGATVHQRQGTVNWRLVRYLVTGGVPGAVVGLADRAGLRAEQYGHCHGQLGAQAYSGGDASRGLTGHYPQADPIAGHENSVCRPRGSLDTAIRDTRHHIGRSRGFYCQPHLYRQWRVDHADAFLHSASDRLASPGRF